MYKVAIKYFILHLSKFIQYTYIMAMQGLARIKKLLLI